MRFDEMPGDGQPDSTAAAAAGARFIDAEKSLGNPIQVGRRDANSGILHGKAQ